MQQYQKRQQQTLLAEIREAIDSEKLTQEAIGKALGLKQSAVSTLLSGKSRLNMEQFFVLCELLGEEPSKLLQRASLRSQQVLPMTPEIESTLYKSELHVLLYASATKEIMCKDLKVPGYGQEQVRDALEELYRVGLLKKKGETYQQKNPHITYRSFSRHANSKLHQRIALRSWNHFDSRLADKDFIKDKFNYYFVDRFTPAQISEINSELWRVYEKVKTIQQSNMLNQYESSGEMLLWNLHVMLMTPFHLNDSST